MKNKKILLIIRWPVGGIRTYINYVFSHKEFSQYSLTIIAPDVEETHVLIENLPKNITHKAILTKSKTFDLFLTTVKHIFNNKYQLINSQGFTSGLISALAAKLTRQKHLMTSHDVIRKEQFEGRLGSIKKYFIALNFLLIDHILSVSHDAKNNMLQSLPLLKHRRSKFSVILNGISVDNFSVRTEPKLREKLSIPDDKFLLGYFGRFMPQKGFLYLVDAINLLVRQGNTNIRVLALGSGSYIREYKAHIEELNLSKYFIFLPFEASILKYLLTVDTVVIPSLWEACPLLPMEALVCGRPVIGTNCIGLREVLQGTPAKMVEPKHANLLAEAVTEYISHIDTDDYINYSEEAKKRFTINRTVKELKLLYESLV